jgi:hypothetical protein
MGHCEQPMLCQNGAITASLTAALRDLVARIYAGILGPLAFLTCLARGVLHAWSAEKALLVAWTSLLAFALLGSVIGWIAEWILEDEVRGRIAAASDAPKAGPSAASPNP